MAKVRFKKLQRKKETIEIEAGAEISALGGRYCNYVQVSTEEEEFALDFFSRVGKRATLVSRVFLSPRHAQRLADLLKKQVAQHKRKFANSPLKKRAKHSR